ncbi:MAG TPA: hypothetical protein VNA25_22675 [Phycisphaerae bacterium]|nr:hypothetical protein [Phycisphaerae bacterium]
MGREIRRVPEGWEHPRYTKYDAVPRWSLSNGYGTSEGEYRPLHDSDFASEMADWQTRWQACDTPEKRAEFLEDEGGPPRPEYHRPEWKDGEATHYQYYETVSEGTPLSPPMPSLEALAEWLSAHQDFWGKGPLTREQADAFCRSGWAPSFVFTPQTGLVSGVEFIAKDKDAAT